MEKQLLDFFRIWLHNEYINGGHMDVSDMRSSIDGKYGDGCFDKMKNHLGEEFLKAISNDDYRVANDYMKSIGL